MIDVAVIGGGVSGLTAAWRLIERGHDVRVLERQASVGGNAQSERIGGFLMEHGPTSLPASYREVGELSAALGLDTERVQLGPQVRKRYLTRDDRLVGISASSLGFMTSPYLSPGARLRMLTEWAVPRRQFDIGEAEDAEESVADFFGRRFGAEFADRLIDPLVGGLMAARADEVSIDAVFPRLREMERRHGSITLGALIARRRGGRMPGGRLYSWKDGIATLARTLAGLLRQRIETGVAVRRIEPVPGGFRIETGRSGSVLAKSVVLATQPHVAVQLTAGFADVTADALGEIPAPPLAVVYLGYRRDQVAHPLDGVGYLTPEAERRDLSGVLFPSTMFAGRAPDGHVALSAYVGGSRSPDLANADDETLTDAVRMEFADLLGVRGAPVITRIRRWALGLPQSVLGHGNRIERIRGIEQEQPGLFMTGNYFSGPGIAHCVREATETAGRVDGHLKAIEVGGGFRAGVAVQ